MVECTGLENQRTARYRGFESLLLRHWALPNSPSGVAGKGMRIGSTEGASATGDGAPKVIA